MAGTMGPTGPAHEDASRPVQGEDGTADWKLGKRAPTTPETDLASGPKSPYPAAPK